VVTASLNEEVAADATRWQHFVISASEQHLLAVKDDIYSCYLFTKVKLVIHAFIVKDLPQRACIS